MKKLWTLLLTLVLAFALVACSTEPTPSTDETTDPDTTETDPTTDVDDTEETEDETADEPTGELTDSSLYLITDVGTIDDKSFNQGSWEGLEMYAEEAGVKANYIQPLDQSDADYTTAISQAVDAGAEIIVTPENPISKEEIIEKLIHYRESNRTHAIIVVTEKMIDVHEFAKEITEKTDFRSVATVLGYVQRGGSPSVRDRVIASKMGYHAVQLLKQDIGNRVVAIDHAEIVDYDIIEALNMKKTIDPELYKIANEISI